MKTNRAESNLGMGEIRIMGGGGLLVDNEGSAPALRVGKAWVSVTLNENSIS